MTRTILAVILGVVGWLMAASATFVWVGRAIYEFVKTDYSFWYIVFSNLGLWALTFVVGVVLIVIGRVILD